MNDESSTRLIVALIAAAAGEFQSGYRPATLEKFIEVATEAYKAIEQHRKETAHYSDCAVNNGPALPVGPCNCGGFSETEEGAA